MQAFWGKWPYCVLCLHISLLICHNDNKKTRNNKKIFLKRHGASATLPTTSSTQSCSINPILGGFPAAKELTGWLFPAPYGPKKELTGRCWKGKESWQQKGKDLKWCIWPFLSQLKATKGWASRFRSGGRNSAFPRGRRERSWPGSAELSLCTRAACFEQLSSFWEGSGY